MGSDLKGNWYKDCKKGNWYKDCKKASSDLKGFYLMDSNLKDNDPKGIGLMATAQNLSPRIKQLPIKY
jgi:hypothetical protein